MASKTTTTSEARDFDILEDEADVDAPDNVIPLREELDDDQDVALAPTTEPEGKPWTTGQKVGAGVGVVSGIGLLVFGAYKLGQRMGWWGVSPLVIDDVPSKDSGGSSSPNKADDKSRPIPSRTLRATGKPPNVSGDPQGYNTKIFPSPGPVRLTMNTLGYKVAYSGETLVPNNTPNPEVTKFQRDWNKVIRGLDSGRVKFPSPVDDPSKLKPFRGLLDEDGIPGKNTLNAFEIALANMLKNKMPWRNLVEQA